MNKEFIEENLYSQVRDPKKAMEMAKAEDPYHKKRFGVFPAPIKEIRKGESIAELTGELYEEKNI